MNKNEIMDRIKEAIPDISFQVVTKNNGIKKLACNVPVNSNGESKVNQLLYVDDILSNDGTIDDVIHIIKMVKGNPEYESITEFLNTVDKDYIMNNCFIRIVNREWNSDRLNDAVYLPYLDLAIMVRIAIESRSDHMISTTATHSICEAFGIDQNDLMFRAIERTKDISDFKIVSLTDLLKIPLQGAPLYVGIGNNRYSGAEILYYTDILKEFADKMDSDLLIVGSSIHEIMIMLEKSGISSTDFRDILRHCNNDENVVSKEEVLSNNLYKFDRKLREVVIFEEE